MRRRDLLRGLAAVPLIRPAAAQAWQKHKAATTGYKTGAVHFDGSTFLDLAALAATNSSFLSYSYWLNVTSDQSGAWTWLVDPAGDAFITDFPSFLYKPSLFAADEPFTGNRINFGALNNQTFSVWLNVLACLDANHAAGARPHSMWINDVDVTNTSVDDGIAFTLTPNGFRTTVGGDTFGNDIVCDLADMRIAFGQFIDFSVTANRRKFISAGLKPVDLGADGSTPTGALPTFFLRLVPAALPSTFATDKTGNGNTFSVSGTLTTASSSPTD